MDVKSFTRIEPREDLPQEQDPPSDDDGTAAPDDDEPDLAEEQKESGKVCLPSH